MIQGQRMVIRSFGGPEVIETEDFTPVSPGAGEILVANRAIGVNFIDTYFRTGLYPQPLPGGLGSEAAGIVEAVGPDVDMFQPGDRVAYVSNHPGAYATHHLMPADRVIPLPDDIDFEVAAAAMLKGMTAASLAEDCARMQAGQSALVHSAAGGVGSILVPWLKDMGVTVIAHAGNADKAHMARKAGADHALFGPFGSLANDVKAANEGKGVDVVFDGVGKDSWAASLASLRPRGLMVTFGNASGPVPPISVLDLSRGGALFLTRPTLFAYIATPEEYRDLAARLFDRIRRGIVTIDIGQSFALSDAAEAHRALEGRRTTGSTILLP